MLGVIETLLAPALQHTVGANATLVFAPQATPPAGALPQLAVFCGSLVRRPPGPADAATGLDDSRDAVYALQQRSLLPPAAEPTRVDLPAGLAGSVVEVQNPPGRLLSAGDGYTLLPDRLQLRQPASGPVLVTWRGERLRGYAERSVVQLDIDLAVWADSAANADRWLARGLASTLAALQGLDLIELDAGNATGLGAAGDTALRLRLLRPLAQLAGLSRGVQTPGGSGTWVRQAAQITLQAELELALSLGRPEPASTIQQVQLGLDTPRAVGGITHRSGTVGG